MHPLLSFLSRQTASERENARLLETNERMTAMVARVVQQRDEANARADEAVAFADANSRSRDAWIALATGRLALLKEANARADHFAAECGRLTAMLQAAGVAAEVMP